MLPRQLGDVEKAFDAVADLADGGVLLDLRDLPLADGAGRKPLLDVVPRVLPQLPEAEGDARCLRVELDDLDANVLTDLEDIAHIGHAVPGELGDMDEAIRRAQVDERAIGRQSGHLAVDLVCRLLLEKKKKS